MNIFSNVRLWKDEAERSLALQMALDEAALRNVIQQSNDAAILRFYRLSRQCVTMGFFMPMDAIKTTRMKGDNSSTTVIRRLTGGGIVFHGGDVTFSLSIGRHHPLSSATTSDRYRVIHEILKDSLVESDIYPEAELVPISSTDPNKAELSCFSKPVGWDIVDRDTGKKIVGGAQRRSNGAWLHQGTVQIGEEPTILAEWIQLFAEKLGTVVEWKGSAEIEKVACELERARYSTREWNNRV